MKRASLSQLKEMLVEKASQSALTEAHIQKLGFVPVDGEKASRELGVPIAMGGFVIPYFDFAGKKTDFWRFRYLETTVNGFEKLTGKKGLRYVQPKNSLNQLYLPPIVDWDDIRKNTTMPIMITEGELKAACACAMDIPTIGLGGVWCFKSSAAHLPVLEQFLDIEWGNRTVFIVYDSDAASNTMVMMAENALSKELVRLGANPHIIRLPQCAPPNKTGLDDYLLYEGRAAFMELASAAIPWGASRELFALNEEVLYVKDPGVVLRVDTMQRLSHRAFIDHAYATRRFWEEVPSGKKTKLVEKSAAAEWIKWEHRASVERVTYRPGEPRIVNAGELNTWKGWGCMPAEGDVSLWHQFMDYVFKDNDEARIWFERWLAYPLQHPGEKMFSAVVMWGTRHGTGKSFIGYTMFKIYGANATEITDKELQGGFNEWAQDKQFVMGDEITGGDKRHSADRMKSMITQKQLRVNQKYISSYIIPDCINYYFTSNHPDAFFLEDTDRRFFIHEMSREPMPSEFYHAYEKWINGSGANAMFHYLLNLDMGHFDPRLPAPMTDSKRDMIDNGRSDLGSWVANLREYPDGALKVGNVVLKYTLMTSTEVHAVYDQKNPGKVTVNGMARELSRAGFAKVNRGAPIMTDQGPQRLWIIRPSNGLDEMTDRELGKLFSSERGVKCKTTTKF